MVQSSLKISALGLLSLLASTATAQGKRGLAYNDATLANLFEGYDQITWGYNWGFPSSGLSTEFEFVPMLWGLPDASDLSEADPSWAAAATAAQHILGFNEPDLSSQSNISPADAATAYSTYFAPYAGVQRIGWPAVTNGPPPSMGLGWDASFRADYTGELDFAPLHWYAAADVDGFISYIESAYAQLNTNIWITEFQATGATDAEQIAFLEGVMPWLDSTSYVIRYSYFGVFEDYLVNSDGTGLSDIGTTYATYTG